MRLLIIFLLILSVSSCKKETPETSEILIEDFNLGSLERFVPIEKLESHTKVIFRDSNAKKIAFDIELSESEIRNEPGETPYLSLKKVFTFSNPEILNYNFKIELFASKKENLEKKFVRVVLLPFENISGPVIEIDRHGNRIGFDAHKSEVMKIRGTSYQDVFSLFSGPSCYEAAPESFYNLYYNFEFGILAFYDQDNLLLTFDRFEK